MAGLASRVAANREYRGGMADFVDRYWTSADGLRLHYRDYAGGKGKPPIICLPGLTRNARDFELLAARHAGAWRVICPEMRGRGDSTYAKDSASYNPLQYVQDLALLLADQGIDRFVAIGTSLGGLMTMIMAMTMPDKLAGAVLNDIGPVIDPAGLARIGGYVGQGRSFPTWMHAARALEETQGQAFPDNTIDDWLYVAKCVMTLGSNGRIVFDYDMKIAEPFKQSEGTPDVDMWPGVDGLAGKPVLFLRGALSDILSADTLAAMQARVPGAEAVTVPRVGHAPTINEPEAAAAIERLLARVS